MSRVYFKEFIKRYHTQKPDSYMFILWSVYKNIEEKGKLSNKIKEELSDFELNETELNKKIIIGKRILSRITTSQKTFEQASYPSIESIQISDFRGFGSLSEEDSGIYMPLDRRKNIFFGPNGSWKDFVL
ncbi:hypothetical protein [Salinicoccus sp. CNSTN-B1]